MVKHVSFFVISRSFLLLPSSWFSEYPCVLTSKSVRTPHKRQRTSSRNVKKRLVSIAPTWNVKKRRDILIFCPNNFGVASSINPRLHSSHLWWSKTGQLWLLKPQAEMIQSSHIFSWNFQGSTILTLPDMFDTNSASTTHPCRLFHGYIPGLNWEN